VKNHTFAATIFVVEMTCNITKFIAILQALPSKTFDNFFRNNLWKLLSGVNLNDCQGRSWSHRVHIVFILHCGRNFALPGFVHGLWSNGLISNAQHDQNDFSPKGARYIFALHAGNWSDCDTY